MQVEITALWSSNHDGQEGKTLRRDLAILWRCAKASKLIFCNFVYQVEAVVDLEKVAHEHSWIMPRKKPHILEREVLTTIMRPIDPGLSTMVAKKYSKSGQLESVLLTNCEVFMKAVVEDQFDALTIVERKGEDIITGAWIVTGSSEDSNSTLVNENGIPLGPSSSSSCSCLEIW